MERRRPEQDLHATASTRRRPVWWRLGSVLVVIVTWLMFVAVGLLLHLGTSAARSVVTASVNEGVSALLQGSLTIESLQELHAGGLHASRVVVRDPQGRIVLDVEDLKVDVSFPVVVTELLTHPGVTLAVPRVEAVRATCFLLRSPSSQNGNIPSIAQAFLPIESGAPAADEPREVSLRFPSVLVRSAHVSSELEAVPGAHADLRGLTASVSVQGQTVDVVASHVELTAQGVGPDPLQVRGQARVQVPEGVSLNAEVATSGARAQLTGELVNGFSELHAKLSPLELQPEVSQWILGWPVKVPVTSELSVDGPFHDLKVGVQLVAGETQAKLTGVVDLVPPLSVNVRVVDATLDAQSFVLAAPKTALRVTGEAEVREATTDARASAGAGVQVKARAKIDPWELGSQVIPGTVGTLLYNSLEESLETELSIGEKEPAKVRISRRGEQPWSAELETGAVQVQKVLRLEGKLQGGLALRATANLDGNQLRAAVSAEINRLQIKPADTDVGWGRAHADVALDLQDPTQAMINAHGTTANVRVGAQRLDRATFTVKGRLLHPEVEFSLVQGSRSLVATTSLDVQHPGNIEQAVVRVDAGGQPVVVRVKGVRVGAGGVKIQAAEVEGLGEVPVRGHLNVAPGTFQLSLEGQQIELARVARVLGTSSGILTGTLRVSGRFEAGPSTAQGEMSATLHGGALAGISGLDADLSLKVVDRQVTGFLKGNLAQFGSCEALADGELAGAVTTLDAWKQIAGSTQVRCEVALAEWEPLLRLKSDVTKLSGTAIMNAQVARSQGAALPNVSLGFSTRALGVAFNTGGKNIELRESSVNADVAFDGATNDLHFRGEIADRGDIALRLELDSRPDVSAWSERGFTAESAWEILSVADVTARASVPPRKLEELPPALRPEQTAGTVSAEVSASGSWGAPVFDGNFSALQVQHTTTEGHVSAPVDLRASATYSFGKADLVLRGNASIAGADVLSMTSRFLLEAPWISTAEKGASRRDCDGLALPATEELQFYHCDTLLDVRDYRLGSLLGLEQDLLSARISGRAELRSRAGQQHASVRAQLEDAFVGKQRLGRGTLDVQVDSKEVKVAVELGNAAQGLRVQAESSATWINGIPAVDWQKSLEVSLWSKRFPISALKPLLGGSLSALGGELNSNIIVTVSGGDAATAGETRVVASGGLAVRKGRVKVSAGGTAIEDINLTASVGGGSGENTLEIVASGCVDSNDPNIKISGRVQLADNALRAAGKGITAEFDHVPARREGVLIGYVTGAARLGIDATERGAALSVVVPKLRFELPTLNQRELLPAEPPPDVTVLELKTTVPVVPPLKASPWRVKLSFGKDVRVTSGDQLSLPLGGELVLGAEKPVSGKIVLSPGGYLALFGKVFEIENGVVAFDDQDVGKADVSVRARWVASDGTAVYVEVVGRLDQLEEPRLSSEPQKSKQELWALLLGSNAYESDGTGATTIGINQVLRDTPLSFVQFGSGSTRAGESVTTATVQVADTVWIEGRDVRANERSVIDGTHQSTGVVDWRFHPDWALRAEVGQAFGLEIRWRYRY